MANDVEHYLEQELRARLAADPSLLLFLVDRVMDGAWYWDLDNPEDEWMSPGFWRTLGQDPQAHPHKAAEWQDLIHPADLKLALANFQAHCENPEHPYDQIVRYRRPEGGDCAVRCRGVAIRDATGKPVRMLGVHVDFVNVANAVNVSEIHERLSPETAKDLLRSLLEASKDAVIGVGDDGRIHLTNAAAAALLALEEHPAPWPAATPLLDAHSLAPLTEARDPIRRLLSGEAVSEPLLVALAPPGREGPPRRFRLSAAQLERPSSQIRMVLALTDITAELRSRQELERLSRLDAIGQLTGGIAHDFNNILGAILPSAQLALTITEDPRARRALEMVVKAARKGRELSKRLLTFAKRGGDGHVDEFSAAEAIDDVAALAASAVEENVAVVKIAPPPEPLTLTCDRSQLDNALLNLVINARDAILRAGGGGTVEIGVKALPGAKDAPLMAAFFVADDGPGMSEGVRQRAMDPFFTTKNENSGAGLGLSMAFGFARQAGGDLTIDSTEGRGATVTLSLPAQARPSATVAPPEPTQRPAGADRQVIVVDDEEGLRSAIGDVVEMLGYRPVCARAAERALELIASADAGAILLTDVVLPGPMDGFELARRAVALRPDLHVIYMSGYTGFAVSDRISVPGPMLQKPCDIHQVAEALAQIQDQAPPPAS